MYLDQFSLLRIQIFQNSCSNRTFTYRTLSARPKPFYHVTILQSKVEPLQDKVVLTLSNVDASP